MISLFSGAGGMDLGFRQAGFELCWANDVWRDAFETYRRNLGAEIVLGALESLSPVPDADIVIGGFPCQGFSVANRQRSALDQRNQLYLQFLRVIQEKDPRYFVAENVKGLLSLSGGAVFRGIIQDFAGLGYRVQHAVLNAADYGVPQRRERVFIVGVREGEDSRWIPPARTHAPKQQAAAIGLKPWVSAGEALASLPEPGTHSGVPNHQDYSSYKLRFNGHLGHRYVDPDLPAPTITARGDERGGVVVIHHPNNERRISPREAAILQSFPIDYEFCGNRTSAYRQVANAVPPLLARAVALSILSPAPAAQLGLQLGRV